MKLTALTPFAAAYFTAMLAPSCVYWNTGTALRESSTINTGVDVLHPVGGKVYRVGKGAGATYYMQAPEVTYTPRHRCVYHRSIIDRKYGEDPGKEIIATDVHSTGRLCWVQVEPYSQLSDLDGGKWRFGREVGGLPAGAKLVRTGDTFDCPPTALHFGTLSSRESGWKGVKRVLSYPAEYVVDPLMWVVGNTGVVAVAAALTPFGIASAPVGMVVCASQNQHTEDPRVQEVFRKMTRLEVEKRGTSFVYSASGDACPGHVGSHLSSIELAEVLDRRKPYCLLILTDLTDAEYGRVLADLRGQGLQVAAIVKDGGLVPPPAKK